LYRVVNSGIRNNIVELAFQPIFDVRDTDGYLRVKALEVDDSEF
jgi:hypothetical protein